MRVAETIFTQQPAVVAQIDHAIDRFGPSIADDYQTANGFRLANTFGARWLVPAFEDERHHIEASAYARMASKRTSKFRHREAVSVLVCTLTAFINSVCSFN
ncbi:hypothetical protein [Rhizobium sullae]|uniref:hypothetical protein n=1 Tax=Rhizobium sullae TaxID=50338 RepID=UPI000B3507ED|nr:hypothetical protein [Rhizobium sullae]